MQRPIGQLDAGGNGLFRNVTSGCNEQLDIVPLSLESGEELRFDNFLVISTGEQGERGINHTDFGTGDGRAICAPLTVKLRAYAIACKLDCH